MGAAARVLFLAVVCVAPLRSRAERVEFVLPSQPADGALMAFCRQAKVELLFPFDDLHHAVSKAVAGRYEPGDALNRLLEGTGYSAKRSSKGTFVITPVADEGSIRGRLRTPGGGGARGIHVMIPTLHISATTDEEGRFVFLSVPAGTYRLIAGGSGFQPLEIADARVRAAEAITLDPLTMKVVNDPARLEPFVVEAKPAFSGPLDDNEPLPVPRSAVGNLDQPRSQDDALYYAIFTRDQIARSGVVNLNEFLQREILDSDATTLPPERNGSASSFSSASSNLNLRGYGADATIVLVDGRRLSEVVTALPASLTQGQVAPQSDVNVIPLNLIERVEVLPVSASAIYSGSPVGGVINIVLRPTINTTELTTTYTNALAHFDAPQSTVSLLHGETLLGGKLQVRFNAAYTQVTPPTESELGYIRRNLRAHPVGAEILYRATPNVSSANRSPLFGPGTASLTSVAPGADGLGGLGAFAGRQGMQSLDLFQPPGGGLADSPGSLDYPYGRKVRSGSFFGSATYALFPWLEVGVDGSASRTVNNTGYSVFGGNLRLASGSAANPFQQDVNVVLSESAPRLGENYDEAHIDFYSAVLGLLFKLDGGWQASIDAQYGLSITRYRGIQGVDTTRWQRLVDEGVYNPLRDTHSHGPPQQFYDQAVIFYGSEGRFVTLGRYDTFDSSIRVTNSSLALPTGASTLVFGGDYRYARLGSYRNELRYGDGSLVAPSDTWVGRGLQRVSAFGELQAPLLPARWLPSWIHAVDADMAVRYTASTLANEANTAPTGAVKVDFAGGFSLRGTYATSNRFPPPAFSHLQLSSISSSGSGTVVPTGLHDPRRGNQVEQVQVSDAVNPNLVPEASVTQTVGMVFQRGVVHHLRLSLDFINTVTSGEQAYLGPTQVVDLESIFPKRVIRAAPAPGDPYGVGVMTSVLTGNFNLALRHSYEWSASLDYTWTRCLGGSLETYLRLIDFQRYDLKVLPTTATVDELRAPDGTVPGLLWRRMNFGTGWSNRAYGFGIDGHYFNSRILPRIEWPPQGSDHVDPYWQYDTYIQGDLGRWMPWKSTHYGIRGQLRLDNVLGARAPRYVADPSGAGVQEYVDWRGRTYSASVTVTF